MTNSPDATHGVGQQAHEGPFAALRERLAELEHEQWVTWSRSLAVAEALSQDRLRQWRQRWVGYADLSEADKELDREYADRVLAILEEAGVLPVRDEDHTT